VLELMAPPNSAGRAYGPVLGADAVRTAVDQTVLAAEKSAKFLDPTSREMDTVARRMHMEDTSAVPHGFFGGEQDSLPFLTELQEMTTAAAANAAHKAEQEPASLSPSGLQAIVNKTHTALDDMFQNGRRMNEFFGNLLNMNSTLVEFDKESQRMGFETGVHDSPQSNLRAWLGIGAIVAIAATIIFCVVPYLFSFTRDLKQSSMFYHGNTGASDDTSPTGSASRTSDPEVSPSYEGSRKQGNRSQKAAGPGEPGTDPPPNQRNASDNQSRISDNSVSQLNQQIPPSMPSPPKIKSGEGAKTFLKGSKKNKGKGKKKDMENDGQASSTYSSPVQNGSCGGSTSPTIY